MDNTTAERRLRNLAQHVAAGLTLSEAAGPQQQVQAGSCSAEPAMVSGTGMVAAQPEADFCPKQVYTFLTRDHIELRLQIFEFLKDELYRPQYHLSLEEIRELTLRRLQKFVAQRFFSVFDYTENPSRFMAALECLSWADYQLSIKAGVHFTLCGGTIAKLGTQKHHAEWLPRIDTLNLPGCFGMTELAHGSNVMAIETTAVYDQAAGEFVINTPHDLASKYWIGGSGQHGKVCAVFAQLTVKGEWQGPHVFVVRIRDDNGNIMPGVRIRDHGAKMGLNGVDNGRIWFDNVRVPRDAMLDSIACVDASGTYSSKVPSIAQRFGATIGGLTTGRILIAQGAVDACKTGLSIAIRYSVQRTQFNDQPIMDYLTHQRRLFPQLAATYALALGQLRLKELVFSKGDPKAIHILSSGLKAAATWHRVEILQNCRECTGGMGFLADNKIGPMKTDMDVDVTFEGDNTVLMQQVAKAALDAAGSSATSAVRPPSVSLAHASGPHGPLLSDLGDLLTFRDKALTMEVAGTIAAATRNAADPKARAAAANAAFEENLDQVVAIGWSHTDRLTFSNFVDQVTRAPQRARPALQLLATLYGLSRVERSMDFYLASGALTAADRAAVRTQVNSLCRRLGANRAKLALSLCDSFGIPDHLLHAPIAFDWTKIQ